MLDGHHADEEKDKDERERPAGDGAGKDGGGGIHVPANQRYGRQLCSYMFEFSAQLHASRFCSIEERSAARQHALCLSNSTSITEVALAGSFRVGMESRLGEKFSPLGWVRVTSDVAAKFEACVHMFTYSLRDCKNSG